MHLPTALLPLTALLTTLLASPLSTSATPLTSRACAYADCAACTDWCWNGLSPIEIEEKRREGGILIAELDIPCPPNNNCGINQATCLILCMETGCCED